MEQLLKFTHSNSIRNTSTIKQWTLSIDNIVHTLEYEELALEIKNPIFHLKSNLETNIIIYNIEEWITKNIIHFEKSEKNYKKCLKLIEYINEHIGDKTYNTISEVEWNIPKYLKLSINLYQTITPNKPYILLTYLPKEKEVFLSEYKLRKFIDNNKETIMQKKACYIKQKEEKVSINKKVDTILKVPLIKRYNLFINRTIKQRYESQACKIFIKKYL